MCDHAYASNFCIILVPLNCMYYETRAPSDNNYCIETIWITNITHCMTIKVFVITAIANAFRQPHVTKVTCSPVDALPSGLSSKFRQCSYVTAHGGEKCSPIIGSLW